MNCYFVCLIVCFGAILLIKSGDTAEKSPRLNSTQKDNLLVRKCNVNYVKIGCYEEPGKAKPSFSGFLMKHVMPVISLSAKWSLRGETWNSLLNDLVCKCAEKTVKHKYNYFGVKSYDQCWSGEVTSFYRHKPSKNCLELEMQTCNQNSSAPCAGNANSVFVYRL